MAPALGDCGEDELSHLLKGLLELGVTELLSQLEKAVLAWRWAERVRWRRQRTSNRAAFIIRIEIRVPDAFITVKSVMGDRIMNES